MFNLEFQAVLASQTHQCLLEFLEIQEVHTPLFQGSQLLLVYLKTLVDLEIHGLLHHQEEGTRKNIAYIWLKKKCYKHELHYVKLVNSNFVKVLTESPGSPWSPLRPGNPGDPGNPSEPGLPTCPGSPFCPFKPGKLLEYVSPCGPGGPGKPFEPTRPFRIKHFSLNHLLMIIIKKTK